MYPTQLSQHQLRIVKLFTTHPGRWFTAVEVENEAQVKDSTARALLCAYFRMKLLDRIVLREGNRYKLAEGALQNAYVLQAQQVLAVTEAP